MHLDANKFQTSSEISVFHNYLLILGSSAFYVPHIYTKDFAAFTTFVVYIVNSTYTNIDLDFLLEYSKRKIPYLRTTTF